MLIAGARRAESRYAPGGMPNSRLKARESEASLSYPVRRAIS